MAVSVAQLTILVRDYDEAIAFFVGRIGLPLLEDTPMGGAKRWVTVGGPRGARIVLAVATTPEQTARIGSQTGGRVGLFLESDDFHADHARMAAAGVKFREKPRQEPYGWVVVFEDLYGNGWDLLEAR